MPEVDDIAAFDDAGPVRRVVRRLVTLRPVAAPLVGAERERAFAAALALNPGWLRFQRRAGAREIPVLRLDQAP